MSNVLYCYVQLRDEDSFDNRQSAAATEASRCFQSASEKRDDHNWNYIGHWPREKREGHKYAVKFARDRSNENETKSQKHLDVRALTPCTDNMANSDSPAMVDGVPNGRQRWTIFQKMITEAFIVCSCGGWFLL